MRAPTAIVTCDWQIGRLRLRRPGARGALRLLAPAHHDMCMAVHDLPHVNGNMGLAGTDPRLSTWAPNLPSVVKGKRPDAGFVFGQRAFGTYFVWC